MNSKRKLFEEVDTTQTTRPVAQPGVIDRGQGGARKAIRFWLQILFALVFIMIAVGGLTRLTDSGLSITEWRPITGALPPLSAEEWQLEFEKYQQIDEWRIQNQWMQMSDFKLIYWWEWGHRQLGRVIGLVWAIGFGYFAVRRQIPSGWYGKLFLLGILGGAQGAVGWWMVASGVTQGEGVTDVASYRLATHLGLAFVILGFISWYIMEMGRRAPDLLQARRARERKQWGISTGLLHFTFLQILLGALVAGIDAGRSYTDWPTMGGDWFPATAFSFEPMWRNFFESPGLVQFMHRVTGYALMLFAIGAWFVGRRSSHLRTRFAFNAVLCAMAIQIALGIVTVLYGAPAHIAIFHQILAVIVWVLILRARFLSGYPVATSVRGSGV